MRTKVEINEKMKILLEKSNLKYDKLKANTTIKNNYCYGQFLILRWSLGGSLDYATKVSPAMKKEMIELRKTKTLKEISKMFNVSVVTVMNSTNSQYRKRHYATKKRQQQKYKNNNG